MNKSIVELMVAALTELGRPAPSDIIQSMLIRDSRFAGFKFCYTGGFAVLMAGGHTLELYDDQNELLKTVTTSTDRGAAA